MNWSKLNVKLKKKNINPYLMVQNLDKNLSDTYSEKADIVDVNVLVKEVEKGNTKKLTNIKVEEASPPFTIPFVVHFEFPNFFLQMFV